MKRTLQAPGSNVSLDIPEGNKGVYVMGVHTDHSNFCGVLKEKECFISPIVEVTYKAFDDYATENKGSLTINIPHCLKKTGTLDLVRVKRRDVLKSISFQDLKRTDGLDIEDNTYSVDENFVRIKTKRLSEFVCISCDTTCQAAIQVFLLGELDKSERIKKSIVTVKSFLCSSLFQIEEYRNVSLSSNNYHDS